MKTPKRGDIVSCSDISDEKAVTNNNSYIYVRFDALRKLHICESESVPGNTIEWFHAVLVEPTPIIEPGDIVTVSDICESQAIENAYEYEYIKYDSSKKQHLVRSIDQSNDVYEIFWEYVVLVRKGEVVEFTHGDRVQVSIVSPEDARNNIPTSEFYYIGKDLNGKYIIEKRIPGQDYSKNGGTIMRWTYIVPYKEKVLYMKSMSEVVKELEDRGFVYEDGCTPVFIYKESGHEFPVRKLQYCGKPVSEIPFALADWLLTDEKK